MNKKILATSALVSTLAFTGASMAQTTITGSLDIVGRSHSFTVANGAQSETTIGRESQINVANKGKLNNGLDYAAGFSLEFDGRGARATGDSSISNEGVYINFISGGTTFHAGVDWMQNSKNDMINAVGDIIDEVGANTVEGTKLANMGTDIKEDMGVGILQNFGNGITASALYVPETGNTGMQNNGASTRMLTGNNSGYELGIKGVNVANSGVSFDIFRNLVKKPTSATAEDVVGTGGGLNYATGPFGVGVARQKTETATAGVDRKSMMYHATYAVDKNLSASFVYAKTDETNTTADEKVKSLMVGYNLGPVGVLATLSRVNNLGAAVAGGDVDALGISLNTRF